MSKEALPKYQELVPLVIEAIKANGGQASNKEIHNYCVRRLGLSTEAVSILHKGNRTEFEYRLAWARTMAKSKGFIKSSSRMTWSLV